MSSKYEQAGVSISKGDELVRRLKATNPVIGGFAGLFPLSEEESLVACTDGIGTKIELGVRMRALSALGQDLVAMCVNDLVVVGATPLFFLDYYATPKLDVDEAESFISGIKGALAECGAVLLGGETAEMPGFYPEGHFDAAGFAVGRVKNLDLIDGARIEAGDRLIALPSSGLHSNGYSLVRKLIQSEKIDLASQAPGEAVGVTWGQALTAPTRLYVRDVQRALSISRINGMAHITGGGLGNIDRVLPPGLATLIDYDALRPRPYMRELVRLSGMDTKEAHTVWNMGTGYVFVLPATEAAKLKNEFPDSFDIGQVVRG